MIVTSLRAGLLLATAIAPYAARASDIAPAAVAQAQQTSPDATAAAPQDTVATDQLRDIVVTAQKRSERLQDVPIAINAVDAQTLESRSIETTVDLPQVSPGLNVRVTNGLFQPTIRGIGTSASFAENPTSLYLDGVYVVDQRSALLDLNDVEQVAVLKGPQGTLFGRNSTAGVIQITTRRPNQETHVEGGASIDNYETVRSDAYLSGGVGDGLAGSLSVRYAEQGIGWGRNLTTGQQAGILRHDFSIRGKIAIDPGPNTAITLIGSHFDSRFDGGAARPVRGTTLAYPGFRYTRSNYDTFAGTNKVAQNEGETASLTIEQQLGFAKLLSISAYQRANSRTVFDVDGVAAPLFQVSIPNAPERAYTQELQLSSSGDSAFSWLLGAFYIHNKQQFNPSVSSVLPPFARAPSVITRISTQWTESIAGFAQATLRLADTTRLTGGIRYTYEKRTFNGLQTVAVAGGAPVGAPVPGRTSVDKPTFRASLDHDFTPDILGYVSYNRGFKSGGYNLLAPAAPPYKPETIDAYEAGLKTELFDRRLRLNVAGFYYDYSNVQVSQIVGAVTQFTNAASARIYGADVDLEARLAPGLTLSGALEVLHARFRRYDNAQLAIPLAAGGAQITSANADGKRLPLAQDFTANAAIDYERPLAGAKVHFNLSAAYQGDYFFEPDNVLRQPDYVTINSSIRLTLPGDRLSLTIFGKNLANEYVIAQASSNPVALTSIDAYAPRTYGVGLRYAF